MSCIVPVHSPETSSGQIAALELVAAVRGERVDARHGQERAEAERHGGRVPHLDAGGIDGVRQILAAEFRRRGEAVPAGLRPGPIGLLPARRHGDGAVLEDGALAVADDVERSDHFAGEAAGLRQHGIDHVLGQVAEQSFAHRRAKPGAVIERELDVGNRRPIGHEVVSGLPMPAGCREARNERRSGASCRLI